MTYELLSKARGRAVLRDENFAWLRKTRFSWPRSSGDCDDLQTTILTNQRTFIKQDFRCWMISLNPGLKKTNGSTHGLECLQIHRFRDFTDARLSECAVPGRNLTLIQNPDPRVIVD